MSVMINLHLKLDNDCYWVSSLNNESQNLKVLTIK